MSTKTMSRSRLSRCATEANTSPAMSSRASSRKSIAGRLIVGEAAAALDRDPLGDPLGRRPACSRAPAPAARPARTPPARPPRRPAAGRPRPCGSPRRSRAAPRPGPTSTPRPGGGSPGPRPPAPAAAAAACSGVRNREIEETSRASAARSTCSARPKLWITFATGLPVSGAARCAPAAGSAPPSHPGWSAASPASTRPHISTPHPGSRATRHKVVCLHEIGPPAPPQPAEQHKHSRSSPHMPMIFGSPAWRRRFQPVNARSDSDPGLEVVPVLHRCLEQAVETTATEDSAAAVGLSRGCTIGVWCGGVTCPPWAGR